MLDLRGGPEALFSLIKLVGHLFADSFPSFKLGELELIHIAFPPLDFATELELVLHGELRRAPAPLKLLDFDLYRSDLHIDLDFDILRVAV